MCINFSVSVALMVVMLVFQAEHIQDLCGGEGLGQKGIEEFCISKNALIYMHADLSCKRHFGL